MMGECGICFDADPDVRALCDNGHAFHPECLRRWNEIDPRCPVCRQPVPFYVTTSRHTFEFSDKLYVFDSKWPRFCCEWEHVRRLSTLPSRGFTGQWTIRLLVPGPIIFTLRAVTQDALRVVQHVQLRTQAHTA